MLSIKVNEETFEVLPDQAANLDLINLPNQTYHLLHDQKSYNIEILEQNMAEKTATLRINGSVYTVEAHDELDLLLKKLGMHAHSSAKINQIKAPMPGLILEVLVAAGDTIQKGDSLLILEAMKMENVIKSPGTGVIKKISVEKGAAVDKNQVLIEL